MKTNNPKDIIFHLIGGVGNQLFIYFAGQYFQEITGRKVKYEIVKLSASDSAHESSLTDLDIVLPIFRSRFSNKTIGHKLFLIRKIHMLLPVSMRKLYVSDKIGFDRNLILGLNVNRVHGYFQSYKYFGALNNSTKLKISPRNPSPQFISEIKLINEIQPISIHIRRGDYLNNPKFGVLSKKYYSKALEMAENSVGNAQVWVFSDDITLASTVIDFIPSERLRFISHDLSDSESLVLMSNSSALIIANSTFSYWAGMFGSQLKTVIAPSKWFLDLDDPDHLYPKSWLKAISDWEELGKNP